MVPVLAAEGTTDDRFFAQLLERAFATVVAANFTELIEVAPVTVMRHHAGPPSVDEVQLFLESESEGGRCSFDVLVFHRDAGTNLERVESEWLAPMRAAMSAVDTDAQLINLVPMVETEAWMLADADAIRQVLGVTWSDADMGLPADVEKDPDPKATFLTLLSRLPARRTGRRRRDPEDYYTSFGEGVSLLQLQGLSAYRQWQQDVVSALRSSGFR